MTDLAKLLVKLEVQTAQYDKALKGAVRELRMFSNSSNSMLGKISAGFVGLAKQVIGFGAAYASLNTILNAVKLGDDLAKAAQKSGIAANAFTELAHAAKMSDISLESLSIGIKKMQVAISGAGSGVAAAQKTFAALGLTFEQIKQLSPDRQFELIADRISQLKSPADKTRAAVELFGRAGADLLPLFEEGAAGIRKARLEAIELGKSLSGPELAKLQEADNAIKRMKASFEALAMTLAGTLGPAIARAADSLRSVFGGEIKAEALKNELRLAQNAVASFGDMILKSPQGVAALERYNKALQAVADAEARRRAGMNRTIRSLGEGAAPGFLPDPEKIKALTDAEVEQLIRFEQQVLAVSAVLTGYNAKAVRDGTAVVEMLKATEEQMKRLASEADHMASAVNGSVAAMADNDRAINEALAKGSKEATATIMASITDYSKHFEEKTTEMTVYADQAARNIQSAFADFLFDPFDKGLKGMLAAFIDTLRRMIAEMLAAKVLKGLVDLLGGLFGGMGKGGGGGGGGTKIGGLAGGGPVTAGNAFMVGEKGPELFVPGASGTIVPNDKLGGGTIVVNQSMDNRGASVELIKALPGILAENNRRLLETILDARSRGSF